MTRRDSFLYFFFEKRTEDTIFLQFFRKSIASLCLLHYISTLQDFQSLYGANGIVPADLLHLFKPSHIPSFNELSTWLLVNVGIEEKSSVLLFSTIYIGACLSLLFGYKCRLNAVIVLSLEIILHKGTYVYSYGVDSFKIISLFYCCVFPVGSNVYPTNPTPYRRILQIHLCFVYFFSGLDKFLGHTWRNGEAVWKATHLPYFQGPFEINLDILASYPLIIAIMGWIVILIEICYPVFIFTPRTRNIWMTFTLLLHIGIFFTLGLYFFSLMMIILNLSAFMDLKKIDYLMLNFDTRAKKLSR